MVRWHKYQKSHLLCQDFTGPQKPLPNLFYAIAGRSKFPTMITIGWARAFIFGKGILPVLCYGQKINAPGVFLLNSPLWLGRSLILETA
jgi:hypothetical protein